MESWPHESLKNRKKKQIKVNLLSEVVGLRSFSKELGWDERAQATQVAELGHFQSTAEVPFSKVPNPQNTHTGPCDKLAAHVGVYPAFTHTVCR